MSNATARPTGESGPNEIRDTARGLNMTVSRNVARRLTELGMTRRQLGDAIGLTRDQLKNRMIGRTPWLVDDIWYAAEALDMEHDGAQLLR
ncbi:hypothetical protein [Cellulosimicrobium sp. I38E]|uniref:hypothetical protein n=1 Tax=Cellulosimicrobium sp. I38E TaxID=1393139 RepID=UPI0007D9C3AB|nr:hypothetical protein [Cellulosimicrobium sp. I38E]